jgi:regulator of protease activity HflC (stomatin/prohibitin superfamily)
MGIVGTYLLISAIIFLFFLIFFRLIRIVPEQEAWIIEEFGKYRRSLGPGLHLVLPVIQKVAYKHGLKEEVIDVPPQLCITKDNVQVAVDGILYYKVVDPVKASYGIENYRFATVQLAQTTMRSEIGRIELDNTFSEREEINDAIVRAVDEASDPWGIKVTRYEIRDISPPESIRQAMEQQARAEREKRAEILRSEGEKEARINVSKGDREDSINASRGERQRRINEAEGRARAIQTVADATAEGIRLVAEAIGRPGGRQAMSLRIAEQFIAQLGRILKGADTTVLPSGFADVSSLAATVTTAIKAAGAPRGEGGEPLPFNTVPPAGRDPARIRRETRGSNPSRGGAE